MTAKWKPCLNGSGKQPKPLTSVFPWERRYPQPLTRRWSLPSGHGVICKLVKHIRWRLVCRHNFYIPRKGRLFAMQQEVYQNFPLKIYLYIGRKIWIWMESLESSKKEFGYKNKCISQGVGCFCGRQPQRERESQPQTVTKSSSRELDTMRHLFGLICH